MIHFHALHNCIMVLCVQPVQVSVIMRFRVDVIALVVVCMVLFSRCHEHVGSPPQIRLAHMAARLPAPSN